MNTRFRQNVYFFGRCLIEENNDPFRDPPAWQKYMAAWEGQVFLDLLDGYTEEEHRGAYG